MLDEADRNLTPVSNLILQKLLYFAHARHLAETKQPLVSGYFEAWQYGPVHPGAYQAFKVAGSSPITFRAESQDLITGRRSEIPKPEGLIVVQLIRRIMLSYGHMNASRLVDISHALGAPWDFVVKKAESSGVLGLRISNDIIVERFKFHKISIGEENLERGNLGEDSPFE
jgi:uncharacterized phage-associated protein